MKLVTPYYLIHEKKLLKNLKTIDRIRTEFNIKFVLALKCFSTWSVFPLMRKYMDGTTSSSLYEARLGREKFKKEVHAYSVAFSRDDINQIKKYADKIIFNSVSQLKMFHKDVKGLKIGIRINPQVSYSCFDLADTARKYSRLGTVDKKSVFSIANLISGAMFHFNCENDNFENFSKNIDIISNNYGSLLKQLDWVSLGGGIYFTKPGYPLEKFCRKLKEFSQKFGVEVYLEPGEAVITQSAELITTVLDVVHNNIDIAIVDSSTEAHMLDLLTYRINAKMDKPRYFKFKYMVAGKSCLAGDVFGTFSFGSRLKTGSVIKIKDTAGYTMVKKNWFNGLQMPSIVIKRLNGDLDVVRHFAYKDFLNNLS